MKGMKKCVHCGTANGTRSASCSKCGKAFAASAAKKTKAKGGGGLLDLVEALAAAEARLCGFEQNSDLDVVLADVRRAQGIAKTLETIG
jgi:hypothetical protein